MTEQIENQTTSLLDEMQNFIKTNKSIHLGREKVISIKDNKICLKKRSGENREIDEHIFIEFIIDDNNVVVKDDNNNTYTKISDVQELWDEFKKQLASKIDSEKNKTKETLINFFGQGKR